MKRKIVMKRILSVALSVMMLAPQLSVPVRAEEADTVSVNDIMTETEADTMEPEAEALEIKGEYVQDTVLVVMEDGGAAELISESEDACDKELEEACDAITDSLEGTDGFQFAEVEIEDDMTVEEAVEYYGSLPGVAFAEPDYILEPEAPAVNDAEFDKQWYMQSLDIPTVWKYLDYISDTKTRIAILDTGADVYHEDLKEALDVQNCINSTTEDCLLNTKDSSIVGHGTHIAGIIGATKNNGKGIAGIAAGRVEIMAIACQDETAIRVSSVVRGIEYAVSHGARLINMSLGTSTDSAALRTALEYAYDNGVLTICSAGNGGNDKKHYPSAYPTTLGIISVSDKYEKEDSSNYGTDNFISAPGRGIYSTIPNGKYGMQSGTSMAAGVVTGVAALLLSAYPSMSIEELKELLAKTATDTYEDGFDEYSGWGVINPLNAVMSKFGDEKSAAGFVGRMYRIAMERTPDSNGLKYWTDALTSGEKTGAEVAGEFIAGEEFDNRKLDDWEYVDVLYKVFMGRVPNSGESEYWVKLLDNGMSRIYVANQFCTSKEFATLCNNCGIIPGSMPIKEGRDRNPGLTAFLSRQYTKALGRSYDIGGLNYWTDEILDGNYSVTEVCSDQFFHSKEFLNKGLSNEAYVKVLYQTFFDRSFAPSELQYWTYQLHTEAMTRDQVLEDFSRSREFQLLRAEYGF